MQHNRMPLVVRRAVRHVLPVAGIVLFGLILFNPVFLERILVFLFPDAAAHIYERTAMKRLFYEHLVLVISSAVIATIIGLLLGLLVTRKWGKDFLPLTRSFSSLVQTFPPVAVLALASPLLGFGFAPTVLALVLFSILPVLNNTITGISEVPQAVIDVSRGMGMNRRQILFKAEIPLAARVISVGVRIAVIINIGTATVGAVIGAGGFGVIIIAGLVRNNPAYIFSGALATSLFALLVNWGMLQVENLFYQARQQR